MNLVLDLTSLLNVKAHRESLNRDLQDAGCDVRVIRLSPTQLEDFDHSPTDLDLMIDDDGVIGVCPG